MSEDGGTMSQNGDPIGENGDPISENGGPISGNVDPIIENGGTTLLEVEHLKIHYPVRGGGLRGSKAYVQAVSDVSFELAAGETLGVVGESGCGKTTLIRGLARLLEPTAGTIRFGGVDITKASRSDMAPIRRQMQMVFQDPQASLNPRKRIRQILATPLRIRGVRRSELDVRSRELLSRVGLNPEHLDRFPHEFSGGQRQRIGIARALAMEPKVIMLDEPVSALDVSIQAQVINLLDRLQKQLDLTLVFVAHDLSVVRHVSTRIAVMYLGKIVELSPAEELYDKPIHPYTLALLGSIPIPDPRENRARRRTKIEGEPPNPLSPPTGCRFSTRCPRAQEICHHSEPQLSEYAGGHLAACHFPVAVSPEEAASARRAPSSPLSAGDEQPRALPATAGVAG
jgi:peptide/nickel transport system ATP-binding protein/oligopeptide transport system ATP-binding protein